MSDQPAVESAPVPVPVSAPADPVTPVPRAVLPNGEAAPPAWRRTGAGAHVLFVWGGALILLTIVTVIITESELGLLILPIAGILLFGGFVVSTRAIWQSLQVREEPYEFGPRLRIALFPFFGGAMILIGSVFALFASMGFARGRQIRRFGRVLLPPVEEDGAWAHLPLALDVAPETRVALAAQWRENGRTEHASVAAFARLTLDLMALGAPPRLIHDANRDAKDEIRHTELCFSLARAIDGRDLGPGPFPQAQTARALPSNRTLALVRLAVDSLIDGALHEGLSARVIAQLAKRCEEPAIREVLLELAADEGRHAAHGWDVVEWCLAEGGEAVALALAGAAVSLPVKIGSDLPEAARRGAWEAFGIHGADLEASEHVRAREHVVARVAKLTTRASA